MATEAEVPESVSATTEGEGGHLTTGKFDITVNQFSPVQLKKSEGEEDQRPEPVKCFVEGEITHVESKNGISECGNPLETLLDSKVDKQEEDAWRKGGALDIGEASVVVEEDSEGCSAVEHSKTSSTDHEGESETNLYENIQPVIYEVARTKLNSEEDKAATLRESSKTITTAEDERQVVEQSCKEEGKVEEANTSYDTIGDETPDEQNLPVASILMRIVTESEIAEVGESTISEPNEIVETSEEVLNVSTVKGDEGDQGDGTNVTKDDKDVDTFSAKVAEDDEYTSAVTIKETSAKVTPNDDESSPQTLQKCDSGEELQHSRDVLPEETKTETSRENAEESTCKKEETTIQHTQESLDEEKKEATENTSNLEDDNAREEVLETSGTKQETGEHFVGEIHTESTQDFVDKETNEETSTESQACVEAADLSTYTEEKNLEEQAILELSSPLAVEETAKEIPKEEETGVLILKEENKEEDAECNEPAEVASLTHETQSETTEDTTEPNKGLSAPISEESNKTFVENISTLAEVSETETEKNIQEKDGLAVGNSDSASGEVSHVTGLKEAETEKEEQKENIDTAPEEKGQATILKDETALEVEDIGVQAEENCESKENLEEHIPTAADEGEAFSKEADVQAEKNEKSFDVEDTNVQAEKNVESNENLEENIPRAADEGETFSKEAEAESKDEIKNDDIAHPDIDGDGDEIDSSEENLDKQIPAGECETSLKAAEAEYKEQDLHADIAPEEKGLATILTDETPKDCVESKEKVEEQITTADEGEKSTYISPEDSEVQEDENFITLENLEKPIRTTSGERETGLGEAEAEIKEQVKSIDIVPEEMATISTTETPLDVEDIGVQAEETLKSKENVEEHIPTAADEGEKFLKEAEAENKEQIDEETLNSQESSDKEKEEVTEITNTKDDTEREEVLETTSTEQETGEHVVHEIHRVPEPPRDSIDKETNEDNSAEYQACTEVADVSTSAEEKNLEEHAIRELSSPLVVEEATKEIPEVERQDKNIDTAPEEKGQATISADEMASEVEDIDVQLKENLESEENLEEQFLIAADEGEIISKDAKAENQEQIKNVEEKKEEDTECNEPSEVASMTHETRSETTEDITEPNKDLNAPISGESNKTFVENISTLAEVSETETEKNGLAVSNSDSASGEVSHVTGLKEAETEKEEQKENMDTAPEEKGQATIVKDEMASEVEDIGVQAEENCESKEKLEEHIPTAADKVETFSKEAEAENEEQINNGDVAAEEKVSETILTNERTFDVEDTNVQAEKNVESNENLEETIPTAADEGETSLQEAEAEGKDEIKSTDIAHADTDGHGDEIDNSEENLDKQIPAGEREISLKAAEAEYKEQVKHADIVPEEEGLATVLTDETPLDVEDIEVKTDCVESKENVEEQIPTTVDEGGKSTYISPEDIEVQADENFITLENLEKPILTTSGERETGLGEAEAEIKEQVKSIDIVPEEMATISTAETPSDVEVIGVQAEESLKSKENVEEQIPTAADEDERFLKESKAENKELIDEENLNSQEQVTEITNTIEDDTEREEVLETTSTEQETGEHVVHEIHTVPEPPRDSIDKETNEDNSAEYQACTEAADLSTSAEEKNLEEHAIRELSSPLVVEEATKEIPKEEETYATLLEEEEKEGHATCNKPNEEYEAEIEINIQEKDGNTVSNSESLSGELSHVTALKECETEIERQDRNIDTAPEEKGQATISADETASEVEDIDVQLKENLESEENLEEQFPTAADEGEIILKEAEAKNQEQIKNVEIAHEDVDAQAEKTVNSEENIDKQILPIAHEGETSLKETAVLILKEEKKEEDTECNEPAEVASMTHETRSETTEDITEPNKDVNAPISGESNKTFVENISTLAEVSETGTEKNVQEKNGPAVSNSDSASGEVSHVTGLKEAETEKEEQKENIDTAPEEKVQATVLKDEMASEVEDIGVQAEENCESKEKLEEHIPTAADKVETFSKEAEAENEEQINNGDVAAEEKVLETILTNERTFDVEDTNVEAEKNVESNENLEETIPTAADEGETSLQEAEAESKDEIKSTEAESKDEIKSADIVPEEKGLATVLTDETPLDVEDIEVKTEDCVESKENVEEQIPTTADEGEKSTYISPEDIEVQADEFITLENLEKPILTSGERETGLGEAEAEIKEQVKSIDIVPEEMATISTAETPSDVEVIGVQAEESLKSKENMEEQIPTAPDEGGKFLKESKAENKELIDEENLNSQESSDKGKQEVTETTNTLEDDTAREEVLETTCTEQETGEHVVHEIHTVVETPRDSFDKETNEENSAGYQACTDAADLSTTAEEKNLEEHDIQELSPLVVEEETNEIPKEEETYATLLEEEKKEGHATCNEPTEKYEAEIEKNIQEKDGNTVSNSESLSGELSHVTASHESETEIERQDKNIDTAAEEKGQATILKENIDTAPEEKGQATILKGKAASEVEDIGVQAEEKCESKENLEEHIPTAADKVETFSKEAEAENEEQINNSDVAAEEKVLETILTNEKSFDVEDTNVQAEKNVESNEDLEENVPTAADEGETFPKEAEAESKDDIKNADIPHADIDGHGDEIDSSEENLDKQIPAGECETSLKAAEAEYKEQVIHADIAPEEKGLATILTDETPLDVEDIEVKTKDCAESKENVEEQIPTTANEGEKSTYISHEHIEVQADENFITLENLENPIPTTSGERETGLGEAEAEIKEQVKSIDIVPEEMATISTTETPLDVEDIGVQAEETLKSKENVEEHIPTAADEGEKVLKEAEAENKEQIDEETLNSQESSDKEKEEVTEITNTKDDTEREEVLETTSTEQETGEHVVHDIHTVPEPPRDSIDKETNEDNSAEYQECTEAADLSTSAEEKNLEEHAIQELSSPLVVEEATNEIPMEEETYTTLLEEEEKEAHATCNEPNEEYEAEIEKNIQEKDGNTVGNSESLSGELSHVTALKESETEIEKQDKNIDTAPEEKGQATISADETASEVEDIDVQLKENLESEENLEEQFPIAAVEGEIMSKEAEAENKEQIKNVDIAHEDVDAQAEKTVNSEENIDYQIQPIAHAGETSLKEAEAEDKEQVTYADIAPEEKGLATILTDETPLEAEDIGVKAEESFESKEKSEEKNPIAADEDETFLKEAEADNKEQIKYSDITPEDKGLATILTDEKALNIEDIGLQADETFNTSKNLESKIPSTADEHETSLKEAEAINTEQFKYTDIVPEEKGLANIVMDETSLDVEDIDVKSDEVSKSKENVEEKIPSASHERGTFLNEAEAESKEHIYNTDISPEEKSLATISTDEATLDVEDIGVQAEGSFESKEDFKEKIPTEDEMFLKEAEAETKEHIKCSDIAPEEKGLENILTDETSLDAKDIEVQAEESFESNENLKEQIPTAEGEGETRLREAEAKSDEQVKNDIASEEKVLETISKDETALDIDDAYVQLQAEENSNTKEFSDEENPTAAAEGEEKIAHGNVVLNDTPGVQILEEAEPKVGVEEESCKSEAQPEKTSTIVEEVFDESKITGRDFNTEEIVEGNVACFTQESIGEDTVNKSQEIETENKNLKEEGSCIESLKEGNGDDLSPEHIPEDESETFKDDEKDAVKSGGEILKRSQADGVDESITCETERSEEIVTSPVTCEEGEQGESSSPVSKEEGSNEDTFSTKVAEVGNGDNGAVMVIETSAGVNGEEGLPQAVQEYEPVEGHEKLLDLMPEESKTESSSENAEVVTCTKEEIKIQNIQESLDEEKKEEETTPVNDTKENETEVEEVFEIASTEQETGEHASREIHPDADNTQEFNDKETTEENLNEYQVSSEAADSSTDIVGKNTDEQASRELSSSLIGEDTSIESSKQEENYVLSLKEEENEANVECKEPVEVANTAHETKFETLEDSIEPKEDLYAPTSEEETHTDLKGAEAETKEQVKDIEIDHEEKGLATILTDGAALENVDSEEFSENQIQTVADEGEYNTELSGDKAAEESFQVQSLEEAEPKLRVEDESRESEDHPENNSMIVEEPQLPEQVLDKPKSTGRDFSEGQTTEGNAAICTPERIQEETAKNSQDSDKETENLMEEGSSIESVKACNTDDPSQEFILEDGSKKFGDNKQDTVKFKGEILKETEIAGVGESTTYETNQIAESSEEISGAAPVKYEEGQPGEGSSQDSAKASKDEDVTEDDDNNGAVTVTESSAEVTSKGEEESAQALEKSEPEEDKVRVKISDVADAKEVCDLEDKASFAEKTSGETSLQTEGHAEVSELALEKLDVEATEEEFKESSEVVPESDSRSIDVVSKDEIVTSQTLDEGISQEQVEIPSSTLLTEAKEIEASQHEHETPTKDKNIEEEHEKEMPADENARDLSAERSEDETPLQKEESKELKASELALEKLDAGDTEEGIKETLKTISKSDSQSIDAVSKDEIVADQTHLEASYALLPMEEELKTYQEDRETTTQDRFIEEEYAKKTEVPADENGSDLVAATLAEETLLKEEPGELKVSELAPENLDAGETKEEIKKSFEKVSKSDSQSSEVVSGDETTANQTLHEGISNEQLQLPSSTLVPEEKEIKISQREHETTTQDKNKEDGSTEKNEVPADENTRDLFVAATSEEETCLQKEEPREFKACDLAPEKLDADETEEIKETLETISKSDSQNIDTVSKDDIVADQTLDGASYTSLPKEKEHEAGESETTAYWALHEGESNTELAGVKAVEESFQVQSLEEAEPKLRVEDESRESEDHPENNMIVEEPQLLEHVLDEPKSTDGDFGEGQTTEGNAALCTPDIILEESPKNSQNIDKEAENLQEEILEEPEIAGVGKSTTYETNQIAETSEEIFDASPVKYGEGSSQDSAKASKEEDVTEDDDNNGAVTVTESSAEVTSKGEEDLAHALEKYEPEEEKVPVKISDVADTKEVCDLEDKASFAEKTTEETSLQTEGQAEVSELAPEKLAVNATEEECKEGSEIVPESDSRSIDVVSKDEIVTSLTLDEGISQDQVKIPSSTLLAEAKEIEASQHEHETPTKDKNIEEEHEKEVLADENAGDLYAVGSEDKTPLQKEESEELKASTLALEKLDAGDTEEEIKETFKTISTSDSQSTDAVPKDEIVADQTHLEASYASLPKEEELKTYQDDREIATQEKSIEEVYAKETEVPADENARDLVAAALAEETLLQKDEPGELKVSVLAPENLDARETEEMKKTLDTVSEPDYQITAVVTSDEAISDQTLHEGISTEKLQIPSSVLLPEEKEIKASEEHGTTFSDKNIEENASNLQMQDDENTKATSTAKETSLTKEEPRELKASDFELHLTQEVPRESSNEEITEDEKLPEESEPDSVREESHHENKAKAEKQGEQTDETSTIRTNEHQNELSEVDEKGIPSEKYERQLTFEDLTIKEHDPRFIEDKTIQDGFPEDEKRVEEAAFEFGLKNQDDEINSKSSITETQMEKDSKKSPIAETSQEVEAKDSKSTNETCVAPEIKERIQMGTHSPEEKEATTTSKEQQIEEDEEEEHESCEEVKTDEEKGENEHKNGEPGYDSPIMVEASRDADVNVKVVSHKKSNNILSGIKHSISKVKKAITGKSSHSKTKSEK
ncbi:uncharacterized protein LOC126611391 isoform X7 [Malus sylvestris]|uniref:uncharacterized protein LOC126611391 isoform X7 n=1 Tax=Malus sylvestris TaxID=3752 RepID=UPI0021AD2370|nr:uncharacterized protein LOC126611391 isoform X7 [Malus sylvestris]